jgi:hypothetical protein
MRNIFFNSKSTIKQSSSPVAHVIQRKERKKARLFSEVGRNILVAFFK